MRAALIALALAWGASPAGAAAPYDVFRNGATLLDFTPPVPDADTPLHVRLDTHGCIPVYLLPARRQGTEIEVRVYVEDYCYLPQPPRKESFSLGVLPAGDYRVTYVVCPSNPLPPGTCWTDGYGSLTVAASARRTIPSTSPLGLALAALLLLVATHVSLRR